MIPVAILVGGTVALCWLRWGRLPRRCQCGSDFVSWRALHRHIRDIHSVE